MQKDIDHVLIRLDLSNINSTIGGIVKAVTTVRSNLLRNRLSAKQSATTRQYIKLLDYLAREARIRNIEFEKIFATVTAGKRDQRAIEFIGDIWSTISGVPSARDHRNVLEKLRLLRIDAAEHASIMAQSTKTNQAILASLHFHDEQIRSNTNSLTLAMNKLDRLKNDNMILLNLLNFKAQVDLELTQLDQQISKAINIMQDGSYNKISESSISPGQLQSIIDKIILRQRILRPVFEGKQVSNYFKLESAHVWADKQSYTIFSLIEIPLADMSDTHTVAVLEPSKVVHADLGLAIINSKLGYYRYLSDSDYLNCVDSHKSKICQKRNIEMIIQRGCRSMQCNNWTQVTVHDLTNTEIMIISQKNSTATLSCLGMEDRSIYVPQAGICYLDTKCSLRSDSFRIDDLSFNKYYIDNSIALDFKVLSETDMSAFRPVTQIQIKQMNLTASNLINLAMEFNNRTDDSLEKFKVDSKARWANIESYRTSWEQIVLWAVTAINAISLLILISYMVTHYIRLMRVKAKVDALSAASSPTGTAELRKELTLLQGKLACLEGELLEIRMSLVPCTDIVIRDDEEQPNTDNELD